MNEQQMEKMLHFIIWLLIFIVGVQFGIQHGRTLERQYPKLVRHGK